MGAGSSTEQRSPEQPPAGSDAPTEPELRGDDPSAEATTPPGTVGDPALADADPAGKLLQKNGQLSPVNGLAEQGDVASLQEGALGVQEEDVIVTDVGQRESEDVREKDPDKEMAAKCAVVEDLTKDGQEEEAPEILDQIPASESHSEEAAQAAEPQANDVGFKKVFKFVGFKFTVKKDKTEKSDAVQLLTVRRDEAEGPEGSLGAGDPQEPGEESGEPAACGESEPGTEKPEQGGPDAPPRADCGHVTEEVVREDGEEEREGEPAKRAESPGSPAPHETSSPFKKFFSQGWAGWRKKTSFRKPKEGELEASEEEEKKKDGEPEKGDTEETAAASPEPAEGAGRARLSADYEKVELPGEDPAGGGPAEKCAPLASEVFDERIEVQQEVVADVHVSTGDGDEEPGAGLEETVVDSLSPDKPAETTAEAGEGAEPAAAGEPGRPGEGCVSAGEPSPDDKAPPKHPEGLVSEVDMLSAQEKVKVQGSPLKKLLSSTGLKKLSGKKQKGRRGGDEEAPGEHPQAQAETPPDSPEEKGDSSASSPEEPEEIPHLEKGPAEGTQEGEAEEGATSDGEKKREGITPWASFKKMVTPKKRVRRPSESDKEEELDKVKSATLSSTESAASEMQEEARGAGDEQKPEEPKRKVDTSVSWEALICVGSSKKRARKASSSDDEGPRVAGGEGQGHKAEEASRDKEPGPEAIPAGSQDQDQGQGGSSPEPAGSPSEGEGVSTWESFKRLVTPRKKSKTKLEEKMDDPGIEHLAPDVEPGKEESWVSIKKLIPGRRKKRPDGKQEQATVDDTGPTEVNEDDSEVPAVVPLSEYDAVEREKLEAQKSAEASEQPVSVSEELSKTLVHTVNVAVIDGTRAVSSVEERSPSWISTSVTEPVEQAEDEATPSTKEVTESDVIAEEVQTPPESREAHEDTAVSEVELTSEAVTAAETSEALGAEEVTEASGADMVSAVSQLADSRDTTEEATPVQEVEGGVPGEEQERRTQAVLQAVAEKVKEESELLGASGPEDAIPTMVMQKAALKVLEKVEEAEEDSEALGPERESVDDVGLKVSMQETDAEHVTPGSVVVRTIEVPEAESSELATTLQAEALGRVKSQEQAVPPDSSETLTDSETSGSTPVAELEAVDPAQQDKTFEGHDDITVATGAQSQVAASEAALALKRGPPAPPGHQSQQEDAPPRTDALEHPEQGPPVEAITAAAGKTEVLQEAGQCAGGEVRDALGVQGLAVSAHTEGSTGEDKMAEVALSGEVSEGVECQKREDVELPSPSPEERGTGADKEREEKPEAEPEQKATAPVCEVSQQLAQGVEPPASETGKDGSHLEGSHPHPDQQEGACTEVQAPSSPVVGKVMEAAEIPGEALPSAGAHSVTAEKSCGGGEDGTPQPGGPAAPLRPDSHTESTSVVVSAPPEDTLHSDLEGERRTSQKERSHEDDQQVGAQEGRVSAAREGDLQAEHDILQLVTESGKLVQNIIQTAVDQVTRTEQMVPETCTSSLDMEAPLTRADDQGAGQTLEKEDSQHPACAQDETFPTIAQEASQPDSVRLTLPDSSQDASGPSEKMVTVEVESSSARDQQFEEVIVPSEGDGDGIKPGPGGNAPSNLGERIEKPPLEPKEDAKGNAAVGPVHQSPALADADISGGLTKESPDTNGPKLTEEGDAQEVGLQRGKAACKLDKESKPQTAEELLKQEGEPARSELTES